MRFGPALAASLLLGGVSASAIRPAARNDIDPTLREIMRAADVNIPIPIHTRSNYYNTKSTSNAGGYSRPGSGPQPTFLGGAYYGGGAKVPYTAGKATPSGVQPRGPVSPAGMTYWPGLWLTPVFVYGPYGYHYGYHNRTSNRDEDRQIECSCAQYSVCMCDEIDDDEFWDELVGDGDYSKLNKTLVNVTKRDGKDIIVVNGTLPNGTTLKSDDEDDYEEYLTNAAARLASAIGVWPAAALAVGAIVLF
ncbi:Conserved glycine-rich protein [Geosmithia morbida]|uniref:Conserved glycine-rich protein n=1 Tax=Geosmithia morbida TaxID=1094350 RepID=A0A9P4Z040_9HYPO|nr:Conserved glycine-rich protein [Geosmithia morbida]KAF4124813.1 Conserved glycine-rich protein [Geosmithia morbida]